MKHLFTKHQKNAHLEAQFLQKSQWYLYPALYGTFGMDGGGCTSTNV
jgi:hypothetical protein